MSSEREKETEREKPEREEKERRGNEARVEGVGNQYLMTQLGQYNVDLEFGFSDHASVARCP